MDLIIRSIAISLQDLSVNCFGFVVRSQLARYQLFEACNWKGPGLKLPIIQAIHFYVGKSLLQPLGTFFQDGEEAGYG